MTISAGTVSIDFETNLAKLTQEIQRATGTVVSSAESMTRAAETVKHAFEAIGISIGAVEFVRFVKDAVDAAAALDHLSARAAISVETLSQLQFAAKLADVGADVLTQGIKKLSVSIAEAAAGNQKQVDLFRALGIGVTDAGGKLKGTHDILLEMARAFNSANDSAGKTAVSVGLMGARVGDQLIPFLNKGSAAILEMEGKADALGLSISDDFAKRADEFNTNLTILESSSHKLAIMLAGELVSGLGDVVAKMAKVTEESGKLAGMKAGLDAVGNKWFDWEGNAIRKEMKDATQDIEHLRALISAPVADIFGQKGEFEKQLADKVALLEKLRNEYYKFTDTAGAGRGSVNPPLVVPAKGEITAPGENAAEAAKQVAALIKKIDEKIAVDQKELALGRALTESEKAEAKTLADLANIKGGVTAAETASVKAKLEKLRVAELERKNQEREQQAAIFYHNQEEEAQKERDALTARMNDATIAANKQIDNQTTALGDNLQQMQLQYALMGATDKERAVALEQLAIEQKRRADIQAIIENNLLTDKQAEKDKVNANAATASRQAQIKADLQDQIDLTNKLQDLGKQMWDDLWSGGHDTLKKLGADIKKFLIDELYQLVVKQWVFNIAANVTGGAAGGVASAAGSSLFGSAGSSAGSSLFSGVGNAFMAGYGSSGAGLGAGSAFASGGAASGAFGVGGGLGGASGAAELAGTGAAVGADAAVGAAAVEGGAAAGSIGAGASAALGAIPVVGWIALAAIAAYSIFGGKGGGPKVESGFGIGVPTRGDPAAAKGINDAIVNQYQSLMATLGGTAGKLELGIFSAKDPQGTAQTQLAVEAQLNGQNIYSRLGRLGGIENVGRSDADLQAALTEETTRVVLKALQASGLQDSVGVYLKQLGNLDALSGGTLNTAIAHIQTAAALEAKWFDLTATDAEKLAKQRAAEVAGLDETNLAMAHRIYNLQDEIAIRDQAKADLLTAYGQESSDLKSLVDAHHGYAESLRKTRDAMLIGATSPLSGTGRMGSAQSIFDGTLSSALAGNQTAIQDLGGAGKDFLDALKSTARSRSEYLAGFARVQAGLTTAAAASDSKASTAQQQLDAMTQQLSALGLINTAVISVKDALASYLNAQANINAQQAAYTKAIADALAVPAPPDTFVPPSTSTASGGGSSDATVVHIEGHATGGLATGLSMVGERGPELVDFSSPGQVYTNEQTRGMFAGGGASDDLLEEIRGFREDMKTVNDLLRSTSLANTAIFKKWDKRGIPLGDDMYAEVDA